MEPQMRMDPSWRKLRSYSGMANTWRKHTLQSPTLDGRLSSLDIHGLPITTQKLTGLTRVSPCLNALVMVRLVRTPPPTISNHLRLHPPTLRCHSDAHCVSSHNHATPVAGLNSDQCLISLDLVPMSRAATYLSSSPYAAFA